MKLKTRKEQVIDLQDWDDLVESTYGRPYSFQQQDGCKNRGTHSFTVPDHICDYENDTVPETVNHDDMGVSFKAWIERDPTQKLSNPDDQEDYCIRLWWERNFYPDVQMIANDLYEKGLIDGGEYLIDINW